MGERLRTLYRRTALLRAALLVFALTVALLTVVVVTLDRNARRASEQEAASELAAAAHVSVSSLQAVRADLRARAGNVASSLPLQRALLTRSDVALEQIARSNGAEIVTGGRRLGMLPPAPRVVATAKVMQGSGVLATVTLGIQIGNPLLKLLERATPLPSHGALIFTRNGRVIAGGPVGTASVVRDGEIFFGSNRFAARSAPLGAASTRVVAVEPGAAIDALSLPYRRRLLLAAILTLAVVAGLATKLARPLLRLMGEVSLLSRMARTDGLTGLANRRAFDDKLARETEIAGALGHDLSLILCDIDHFKQVNDRYGHQAGDQVLRAVSALLATSVRDGDSPARFGGEELAIILPRTPLVGARRLAERVRRELEGLEVELADGATIGVTASFGAASFATYSSAEGVLKAADEALYEAKEAGRNRVVTATARKKSQLPVAQPA